MGTSGATSVRLSLEMALERLQHVGERLQLLEGERVNKLLLDGAQVGRARPPERCGAAFRERHLGPTTVAGTVTAVDEAASLHPCEVMGQPATLQVASRRQLCRPQALALGSSHRHQ